MGKPMETSQSSGRGFLSTWMPENPEFWKQSGQVVARRNLWISVPCLLLAFCVWMLFSVVAVNLNRVGFSFTTDQLFMLTALPSISGALLRIPYSFVVPVFGGRRWTSISTAVMLLPCVWLGLAVQDTSTPFSTFVIIALLCGLGGGNFASSMANISFFFPKSRQGSALGLNGGLGNLGVSVMQLLAPLAIAFPLLGSLSGAGHGGIWLQNAAWVWIVPVSLFAALAWFGMNDLATAKASVREQLPVLKRPHMWVLSGLYLATFGSFIGFSAGFAMLTKTQFPEVNVANYVFFGPLAGALARPVGGMLADRFGGTRISLFNFIAMAVLAVLVFFTLPGREGGGSFIAFFATFLGLFLTAGLGSGSTFQMISLFFRKSTAHRVKTRGGCDQEAQKEAARETAAALGFISAIGAMGGFFIPKAFGTSLTLTGSASSALLLFIAFYAVCIAVTWLVYGKHHAAQPMPRLATKSA